MTDLLPPTKIKIASVQGKGRGVVATKKIKKGEIIEKSPFIILSQIDTEHTVNSDFLHFYIIELMKFNKTALMLGYGSLYNHSYQPNMETDPFPEGYEAGKDLIQDYITFRALRDIEVGEELTFSYYEDDEPAENEEDLFLKLA